MSAGVSRLHADEAHTDVALVYRLLAAQFPRWAGRDITPVTSSGTDNALYRLGEDLVVRLPRIERSAAQVEKERLWLPKLAPRLPIPIPEPLAIGAPAEGFAWPWSVYRWIPGETAALDLLSDPVEAARELAGFITDLHRISPVDGPAPGPHNVWRGQPIAVRDAVTRRAIDALAGEIDATAATAVWDETFRAAPWPGPPVWVHGDLMPGNLLVAEGRLGAVIDFGCLGVGDPACELMPAWNLFAGESRRAFRAALGLDEDTWIRGQGWALHSGLMGLPYYRQTKPDFAQAARRTIEAVLSEHRARR